VQWPVGAKLRGTRYYDLLRQLAAQIKKTYIHKTTAGDDYKRANTHTCNHTKL